MARGLLPPSSGSLPKQSVSRVLFRRRSGDGDHSSRRRIAAALERSNPRTGTPKSTSDEPSSTVRLFELAPGGACPAAGHPAVARGLLPHDFNLACASSPRASQRAADRRPSAVWFLLRFPSGHPGSLLATSLPCGARTFLPRTVCVRRRSSDHLRQGGTLTDPGGYGAASGPVRHRQVTGRQRVECPFASESSIR